MRSPRIAKYRFELAERTITVVNVNLDENCNIGWLTNSKAIETALQTEELPDDIEQHGENGDSHGKGEKFPRSWFLWKCMKKYY